MTVTINGTTGYTGPIGAIGDLSTTGNTTLGDASGDTLTINGSTTTFTQGTANGVAYLNGSKVLTTGSALTFDGTTFATTAVASFAAGSASAPAITRTGDTNTGIFFPAADTLAFTTNGTEDARFDSAGNFGLGVTPSAWTVFRVMQVGSGFAAASSGQTNARIFGNTYYDGAYKYVGTGRATQYEQDGYHAWYTSTSGTAGGTISFTQAMTLDASGNLGVGTASPATPLHIYTGIQEQLRLGRNATGSSGYITFFANNSSSAQVQYAGILGDVASSTAGSHGGNLLFYTTGSGTSSERARITSSGAFGVANSNPSYLVDVGSNSGTNAFFRAEGSFIVRKYSFNNNGTTAITLRLSILNNGLQFSNFFMDASAHYFNNGGSWQVFRYAFQFMNEGGTLRHNIRMPNYEYGGSTSGVFTVGNPPSWTYDGNGGWYFDFTVAGGFVSYITLTSQGPGIRNLTLTAL